VDAAAARGVGGTNLPTLRLYSPLDRSAYKFHAFPGANHIFIATHTTNMTAHGIVIASRTQPTHRHDRSPFGSGVSYPRTAILLRLSLAMTITSVAAGTRVSARTWNARRVDSPTRLCPTQRLYNRLSRGVQGSARTSRRRREMRAECSSVSQESVATLLMSGKRDGGRPAQEARGWQAGAPRR
jgi:hypothetical protein